MKRLMRANDLNNQSSMMCCKGYTPRKGKEARRAYDCVINCEDTVACEEKRKHEIDRRKRFGEENLASVMKEVS